MDEQRFAAVIRLDELYELTDLESELLADLRATQAELAETHDCHTLAIRQADLLTKAAAALRGVPPDDTSWSHHDIAERIEALKAERDRMRRLLEEYMRRVESPDVAEPPFYDVVKAALSAQVAP